MSELLHQILLYSRIDQEIFTGKICCKRPHALAHGLLGIGLGGVCVAVWLLHQPGKYGWFRLHLLCCLVALQFLEIFFNYIILILIILLSSNTKFCTKGKWPKSDHLPKLQTTSRAKGPTTLRTS